MTLELSTKEMLLNAALEIIGQEGSHDVSIRGIAARAGVNSAAISYYFGSKDKLIKEASKHFYQMVAGIFLILDAPDMKPLKRLESFSLELINYIGRFPGFLKNEILGYGAESKEADSRVGLQIQAVEKILREITGIEDKVLLTLKAVQLLSALIYPQLGGKHGFGLFFADSDYSALLNIYIEALIKSVCNLY